MAQGDVDTDGEADVETVLTTENLIEERPFFEEVTLVTPLTTQRAVGPRLPPSFFNIQEVPNVKDLITSRLSIHKLIGQVGGSSGQLVLPKMEQTKVYTKVLDAEEEKMALVANKNEEKGKLQIDPFIETSWQCMNTQPM